MLRIAQIGCGRIGTRRARAAIAAGDQVLSVADVDPRAAQTLAHQLRCEWTTDWEAVIRRNDIDAIVVSTVNSVTAPATVAALRAGKHVLCEKPMGRNVAEARAIADAADESTHVFKVGFNHRYHPALVKARELLTREEIGRVLFVRAAYGHGGRPGYEKEWRGDPDKAGGGELLDQGTHLIDLCRWFMGEFKEVQGLVATWVWPVSPLEDNAFALLHSDAGAIASIHVSWTQWRNLFRFEVIGTAGYVVVEGLGGNYGPQSLAFGLRNAESRRPTEQRWEFPDVDETWDLEWTHFRQAIAGTREISGGAPDGYAVAVIVDAIYRSARGRAPVDLKG